jgi:hypothetical protein
MKTVIISDFQVANEFIKDALSDLQPNNGSCSWYKGKFYTKELILVEFNNKSHDLSQLLDMLITKEGINKVISISLGSPLSDHLRSGDVLINDLPNGSCQKLIDLFLDKMVEVDGEPLRVFVGNIIDSINEEKSMDTLACVDCSCPEILSILKNKGLSTLLIRVITPKAKETNLDTEIKISVAQKLLFLLKKTIEQIS